MGFGHVIPHLVERFLDGETPFKIYGANQTRSFCYIDDGALGTIQAMECEDAKNDIFHIGNEEEITIGMSILNGQNDTKLTNFCHLIFGLNEFIYIH